ncbi:uncharacterized protein ACA1_395460 [Acanthamoeba castellanii str. Neff]|uniref:PAS domain-containing protein n=1 Tax=Acanthamoeba castellanii (strain ATCC 30010 / Neff) TaxID=1257118 RepID=L8H0F9_ACACF|nr:uncharacterized protein ACA1_395460 [Acanthamoeba castellanii str. Neff]ELR18715.1 hypothetical protein ACA1_395460 [Acanthamoeba castellanii str. Neff]
MLVVDQVREMRRENERLHDTIAQLRAMQKKTERRLARVEQDQQQTRTETERRLARVEQDHQTIKSRQLAQTGIEINQKSDITHRLDHVHTYTSPACPPSPSSSLVVAAARPPIPPQLDSHSSSCVGVPLAAAAAPTTSRAEVERFIAQTLPFLRAFDQSSLIICDLRRPFVVMHMNEVEALDDLVPIIVYASPSLCKLLSYDQFEMHGSPISSFGMVDQEFLPMLVQIVLMPSPTPVGQPLWTTTMLDTKHGRSMRVSTQQQYLFNQRRMAQWVIMQVDSVLEMDLDSTPLITPRPSDVVNELTARAIARVQLLARLPQALLLGRRGRGRELTTTTRRPGATHHHRDSHRQAFVEQAGVVGERTTQKEEAPTAVARTGQQDPGLRADAELEELIRVLGRSLSQRSGGLRSPQMLGFTPRTPPTPSSLAERWMR